MACGYAVLKVGFEDRQIKRYIQNQEQLDGCGSDEDGNFWTSSLSRYCTLTLTGLGAC